MNQVTKKKLKGIEHFKIKSIKINTKPKMKKVYCTEKMHWFQALNFLVDFHLFLIPRNSIA